MRYVHRAFLSATLICSLGIQSRAGVSLGGFQSTIMSSADPSTNQVPSDHPSQLPYLNTVTHTFDSGTGRTASSATTGNLNQNQFSISFSHQAVNGGSTESDADLYFIPSVQSSYSISGTSTASAGTDFHYLKVRLLKINSPNVVLFLGEQSSTYPPLSSSTASETFAVGGSGGTSLNSVSGSLTGNLDAGSTYLFEVIGNGSAAASTSITNTGNTLITFTELPEPSLALVALSGLLMFRRRSRLSRVAYERPQGVHEKEHLD